MNQQRHIVDFYTRHPISAAHILAKLRAERGTLDGLLPEDLWSHDQDHYGGLSANDTIARKAKISAGTRVVDFCAGLGGPARYMAARYDARVTGIELNPSRAAGANDLTRYVGLTSSVCVIEGNVQAVELPDESADVVMSQEAMLHVPDKARALTAAHRLLVPGGRLCFTDWIAHQPLTPAQADLLWRGLGAQTLQSMESYRALVAKAGFKNTTCEDLTGEWAVILAERRAMYRKLRSETIAAGMPAGDEDFYQAYVLLVDSVQAGVLGGARFTSTK